MLGCNKFQQFIFITGCSLLIIFLELCLVHRLWKNCSNRMKKRNSSKRYCYVENNSTIIFLHLSNQSDQWTPIEMCAIKSASLMNPVSGVCVLTKYPMKKHPKLVGLSNLEISTLNIPDMFSDTPLKGWYEFHSRNRSDYFLWHTSDALRYIYLYKYGGKYLDTDCLVLRDLSSIRNAVGWEPSYYIGNSAMAFEKGHHFIMAVLDNFQKYFRANKLGSAGPGLLTRVHLSDLVNYTNYTILHPTAFFPVSYQDYQIPFSPQHRNETKKKIGKSYLIHLWRQLFTWNNNTEMFTSPPNGSFIHEFLNNVCLMDMK